MNLYGTVGTAQLPCLVYSSDELFSSHRELLPKYLRLLSQLRTYRFNVKYVYAYIQTIGDNIIFILAS